MKRAQSVNKRWSVLLVESPSTDQDSAGQVLDQWTPVATIQGTVTPASQHEAFSTGQFTSQVTHAIDAWWTKAGIAAGMRITYGTRRFLIQSVVNVMERNREIVIWCLEINGKV